MRTYIERGKTVKGCGVRTMESLRKQWRILTVIWISWMITTEAATCITQFTHMGEYQYADIFQTIEASSCIECCAFCNDVQTCIAANFNKDVKSCQLTGTAVTTLSPHTGWELYAKESVQGSVYDLDATATQSSVHGTDNASKAIDGDMSTSFFMSSCTHTDVAGPHWWRMDFGLLIMVGQVIIYNRSDCCSNRLRFLTLSVSHTLEAINDAENICTTMENATATNPITLTCTHKLLGQYLQIYKDTSKEINSSSLTLCEIVVKS